VLLLVGAALVAKSAAAMLMLKPSVWETWLKSGVSIGMTVGLLVLLVVVFLPRPVQIASCAIALLASLLLPVLGVDMPSPRAPLTLFNWRYGHLLNFNGLTHAVLIVWPVFASYVVSFLTVAVYWVNHHAMLHQARRCTPAVLWANIFWLFCLSLIPFATGYVGENHVSRFGATMYCGVLLLTGFGYLLLRMALAQEHRGNAAYHEAYCSASRKHYTAIAAYAVAMVVSWFLSPYVGFGISFLVVAAYFIPNEWLGEAATEKA